MPESIKQLSGICNFLLVCQPSVLQLLPLPYQLKKWQDKSVLVQHGEAL
jgi:hypothetical protein